jgi:hypothetical protein
MKNLKTTVTKKHYGWNAETNVNKNGFHFNIFTCKQSDGIIRSTAQKILNISETGGAEIITYNLFDNDPDNRIILLTKKATATEQNIKSFHAEALAIFETYQLKSIKPNEPGINTIFWLDGYNHYKGEIGNEYICFEVETDKWGTTYKCVEPTELKFLNIDHPRHESKKFGIGHYYCDDYNFIGTQNDLNNIIIEAHQATKVREAEQLEAARLAKIAADEKAQELSKYIQADVRKTGALIKNYAKSLGITSVSVKYDSFSGGDSYRVSYKATEKNETFEKYCNNLQTSSYNAYEDYWGRKEDFETPILEGFILETFSYVFVEFEKVETTAETENNTVIVDASTPEQESDLVISEYSDKAIVLRGNTKPIKDQLKQLGGSFNFKLKGGAGWIFSKKREAEIRKYFNI